MTDGDTPFNVLIKSEFTFSYFYVEQSTSAKPKETKVHNEKSLLFPNLSQLGSEKRETKITELVSKFHESTTNPNDVKYFFKRMVVEKCKFTESKALKILGKKNSQNLCDYEEIEMERNFRMVGN